MAQDPTTQALLEQQNLTDNKALAVDAPISRVQEGHDKTLRQVDTNFNRLVSEGQALFTQTVQQRDVLFAQMVRHADDNHQIVTRAAQGHLTLDFKNLDKDTSDISSEGVGAKVVEDLAPQLGNAVEAAVAKNVNNTESVDLATLASMVRELGAAGTTTNALLVQMAQLNASINALIARTPVPA